MTEAAEASALLARIDALNRRYGHAIDDGAYERWPGFFVEDALYKITTRWNHDRAMPAGLMLCQGRAMMQDRVSALRSANIYEPHFYRHLIDPPASACRTARSRQRRVSRSGASCSPARPKSHQATASFAVWRIMQSGAPEIFCTGRYVDRIVEADGALKFSQRIVVCDGERIDTMIVLPL